MSVHEIIEIIDRVARDLSLLGIQAGITVGLLVLVGLWPKGRK